MIAITPHGACSITHPIQVISEKGMVYICTEATWQVVPGIPMTPFEHGALIFCLIVCGLNVFLWIVLGFMFLTAPIESEPLEHP
jgi:hypothetical protein